MKTFCDGSSINKIAFAQAAGDVSINWPKSDPLFHHLECVYWKLLDLHKWYRILFEKDKVQKMKININILLDNRMLGVYFCKNCCITAMTDTDRYLKNTHTHTFPGEARYCNLYTEKQSSRCYFFSLKQYLWHSYLINNFCHY